MPRPANVRIHAARLAALTGFLVLAPRRAAAMPQPVPPRGPVPPCASGPGGLIGCIPSPGNLLSGAARTAGGGVMKVFTAFFTDGANWFLERLEELVTAPTRPDLSVGWWVEKYNLMLALAAVVAAATLILALIDDAAKGSPEGLAKAVLADVPVAGLVGGIGPLVIQYLVDLADWLNGRLLQDLGVDSAKTLSSSAEWFAAFSSTTGSPATPAVAALIAALVTILAAFVIFLERAEGGGEAPGGPGTQGERADTLPKRGARGTPPPTAGASATIPSTTAVPTTITPATSQPGPAPRSAAEPASPDRPPTDDPVAVAPAATALTVGGLLAFGLLAVVARLRRRQQRHRQPGRRPRLPVGTAARTEQHLRAAAEPGSARFLDLALRVMAAGIRYRGLTPPVIDAVLLEPTTLEVILREPASAAPPPFALANDGRRWTVAHDMPSERLKDAAGDAVAPLPGLVTLGMTPTGQLLINLEAPGLTALAGPPSAARPLLDAMAVELATAASSGFAQIVLVGFGPELDQLERVQRVDRLEDALSDLERQAREAAELVDKLDCGSVLGGRIAGAAADSWTPTIVLVAEPVAPASLERLAAITGDRDRSTVAAVVIADAPLARWRLEVDEDRVRVPGLDLEVQPQRLSPEDYAAIGVLLQTAADTKPVSPSAPPYDTLQPPPPADPGGAAVEVRVLGRIDLAGAGRIERSKSIELIVYLALHPQGVTPDELWEALWPDRPVNRGTLHTTVTAARTGLGRAPDGTRYLPDAHAGQYRLSPQVGLDWARFHALIAQGEAEGPDALDALGTALELARGVPLTSPTGRGYEWAVVHRTEMETVVAEVAERLALRYLEQGDHRQANWAARRGLLASPYDERLYRVLMRAADAAGNPAGVDAIWKELLSVLDADLDLVDDELHPETIQLYAELRPQRRPRPAAPSTPRSSTSRN